MFENFVFRNIPRNIEGPGELSQRSNPEYDDIPPIGTVSSRISGHIPPFRRFRCGCGSRIAVLAPWTAASRRSCEKFEQNCTSTPFFRLQPLIFRSTRVWCDDGAVEYSHILENIPRNIEGVERI